MINSRLISDLLPAVALMAEKFKAECKKQNIDILIYSTYRDMEAQAAEYAKGRTAPGKIVTNAKPGSSYHNWRCAFDFVPLLKGQPQWSDSALYLRCGIIAESVGLEWAGRWVSFRETAHCQYTNGLSISDLKAGRKIA
jgi:peptidoglycan L-alanyl-D-glutamate endopeptidase CwlK